MKADVLWCTESVLICVFAHFRWKLIWINWFEPWPSWGISGRSYGRHSRCRHRWTLVCHLRGIKGPSAHGWPSLVSGPGFKGEKKTGAILEIRHNQLSVSQFWLQRERGGAPRSHSRALTSGAGGVITDGRLNYACCSARHTKANLQFN